MATTSDNRSMDEQLGEARMNMQNKVQEIEDVRNRIMQLEFTEREHVAALEVLKSLPKDRKTYRLAGEVLIERSVDQAIESVDNQMKLIQSTMQDGGKRILEVEKEVIELSKFIKANQ